jgi:hypothetical protein
MNQRLKDKKRKTVMEVKPSISEEDSANDVLTRDMVLSM